MNKSFSPFFGRSLLRFSSNMLPYSEYIRSENTEDEGVQSNFRASSCISGNWVAFFHHSRGSDFRLISGNAKNGSISCATSCSLVLPSGCLVEVVDSVAISMKHEQNRSSSFDFFLCGESGGNCDSWSLLSSSATSAWDFWWTSRSSSTSQAFACCLSSALGKKWSLYRGLMHVAVTYSFLCSILNASASRDRNHVRSALRSSLRVDWTPWSRWPIFDKNNLKVAMLGITSERIEYSPLISFVRSKKGLRICRNRSLICHSFAVTVGRLSWSER